VSILYKDTVRTAQETVHLDYTGCGRNSEAF